MAARKPFENTFSWSSSRGKTLDECHRKYFNTYYGSWGGWNAPPDSAPAQVYLLKKMDSRFAWSGHVAHAVIAKAVDQLLKNKDVSEAAALEAAHQLMRDQWSASLKRAQARAPAQTLRTFNGWKFYGLLEHELKLPVPDEEWRRIWARTEAQLRWWFRSDWPRELLEMGRPRAEASPVLMTDDGDFARNRFAFDDTHVLASPDLAFMGPDGTAYAVDWKGGRPDHAHVGQVTSYGHQLLERFGAPYERTTTLLVYLGRGEVEQQLSAERVDAWRETTRSSISTMRGLLEDPAKNKPKPIEAFAMTRDRSKCTFCQYRRRCGREEGADHGAEVDPDAEPVAGAK